MKKLLITLLLATSSMAWAQEKPFVVPAIESWKAGKGQIELSQLTDVTYSDASLSFIASYLRSFTGMEREVRLAGDGFVQLNLCKNKKLGSEGYVMELTPKGISIQAQTQQGVVWGVQTLQQLLSQGKPLPCGTIIDSPAYPMRGMMIDCGRKFFPLTYLYSLVDLLSYYKMNTLQVHLNDNALPKYFHGKWDEAYAAFRMQSDLFPGLTAKDGSYGKDEFREFIRYAERKGVEIIPEFDTPAHSLAFTRLRPSLACEEYGLDHFDLRNPDVIPFIDSLYSEYLGGDDPVFCCPRMHIGTDEYNNKDSAVVELFRSLTDHLIREVESYGKQAVFWGSLTHAKGVTPVKANGVMMGMWHNAFADPKEMKRQGYQMICIPDRYLYIVPEAGYYHDYLDCKYLYERWTPALIRDLSFPERDPQISGGMFAVWNDICGNGISVGDIHHRLFPAVQVVAEKTWRAVNDTIGYARWDEGRKRLGEGFGCNELGSTQAHIPVLEPSSLIADSDAAQIGYDYEVSFTIDWAKEDEGTVLTEGRNAKVYLSDPIGGWLGFSRDGYLFTFQHKGVPGKRERITIAGTNKCTTLYIDGRKVQELGYDQRFASDKTPYNTVRTLVFPLARTGNFKSKITDFKANKK